MTALLIVDLPLRVCIRCIVKGGGTVIPELLTETVDRAARVLRIRLHDLVQIETCSSLHNCSHLVDSVPHEGGFDRPMLTISMIQNLNVE